ncbi:hypothetical protein PQ628_28670 [Bacteroides ovatus]|uniref:Uncharacterized protein n=2 Tax=Bacteroides TaxID=816 RepID=A0AAW6IUJ0_BACOV|nr:hypothetical protein [Bacteroides faecis]MCS2936816.1 hypothetical protein [Bacteroides faecis]MDC7962172.1 hypothetical protein [Bacteroides ovatus]UVS47375.1 hypothetical protein NXW99_18925 [Bacteroides faecis]UWD52624.1 MAG: hypothetical protein [Bacteriophage sp.]
MKQNLLIDVLFLYLQYKKMEVSMCILKEVGRFIKNGASTFRNASQGNYKQNSGTISEIRKEIMEKNGTRSDDKKNLMEDRRKIEGDVRKSFDEIVLNNG